MVIENDMPMALLRYLGQDEEIAVQQDIYVTSSLAEGTPFTIGCSPESILYIQTGKVSRRHAMIEYDAEKNSFMVTDLGSTNGTYIQGNKIVANEPTPLEHKDYLQFSRVPFQFRIVGNTSKVLVNDDFMPEPELGVRGRKSVVIGSGNNTPYQIECPLKKGGMGSLYKAIRLSDKTPVVLKFLPEKSLESTKNVLRFVAEARTTMRLDHPNIVKGLELHQDTKNCFMVMEYIPGPSIAEMLSEKKSLSVVLATEITTQIARALVYLEEQNICHRDIKPSNIIWSDGTAKLVDFGIAKAENISLTTQGFIVGTVYYMSPEQVIGTKEDVRADIYSLGVTFYHMLTGKVPFCRQGASTVEIVQKRISSVPLRADNLNEKIPVQLAEIVQSMLEPNKRRRILPTQLLLVLEDCLPEVKDL